MSRHGSEAQKEGQLPGIIGGEDIWALAYAEPQSRFNPADVLTSAKADGDGYVLNGTKAVVVGRALGQQIDCLGAYFRRATRQRRAWLVYR